MPEYKKEVASTLSLADGVGIEDSLGRDLTLKKVATRTLLPAAGESDGDTYFIIDEDIFVGWDAPTGIWKTPKAEAKGWLPPVASFDNLATLYPSPENGDTCLVRDENTLYSWNSTTSIWSPPAAYAKGFTSGCRLVYKNTTTIDIDSGTTEIKGNVVSNSLHTTLGWTNLDIGTTKKASTWYYVYVEVNSLNKSTFTGFISEQYPTKDDNGNTQNPDENASKYHPTRNARFVGSFRTNASQNIVNFRVIGNYITYIGQGYNYFLTAGNARTKTGVNCRAFVPLTSSLASVYYEFGSGTNIRNVGDVDAWYINGPAGVGTLTLPITNNSVYYMCSGSNVISLGIHGYYEDM